MPTDLDRAAPGAQPRRRRRSPPSPGRRTRLHRAHRRRMLRRGILLVAAILALAVALVALVAQLTRSPGETAAPDGSDAPDGPQEEPFETVLLVTFDEADEGAGASLVAIVGHDRRAGTATLVFVPATTLADVPGHGLTQVGRAFAYGGAPLLDATLANLLGVRFDHTIGISRQAWSALFARVGGLTVDLRERLVEHQPDGSPQVRFETGEQFLDGPRLAELLTLRQRGETELARLPRVQHVLTTLLAAWNDDPDLLDAVFADGAPMLDSTATGADLRALFDALADLSAGDGLVMRTLPVTPIGSGDDYRVDRARVDRLVAERFSGAVLAGGATEGRNLQVLNGHGRPGIGQDVAQLLIPAGFRVVLTGNADHFGYEETRIVVYRDDAEQVAIAGEIRDLLGVGRIELSRTPQSVVDVTIVVGRDFPSG